MTETTLRHLRMLGTTTLLPLAGALLCLLASLCFLAIALWLGHAIWDALTRGIAVSYELGSGRAVSVSEQSRLYWWLLGTWMVAALLGAAAAAYLAHAAFRLFHDRQRALQRIGT